jgi:hypothetical protein
MIDGLKLSCRINDFEAWKSAVNIPLFTPTDIDSGAIKQKTRCINGILQSTITHGGKFETLRITVKETTKAAIKGKETVTYYLRLDGSLHKNNFGGANFLPFTWNELQEQIKHIETSLQLDGETLELINLEIGVNVSLPFPVFPFLKNNLISYKGNSFNQYSQDKNGVCLGFVSELSQYSIKIYDKGKQYNLPGNVMRFELRFTKMQKLKGLNIRVLSDLKDFQKVNSLLYLLLNAWENVLLFESTINMSSPELKIKEMELLQHGSNPKFWEKLKETNKRRFNYKRDQFKKLVALRGKSLHETIKKLIETEWQRLAKNCTIFPSVQNH